MIIKPIDSDSRENAVKLIAKEWGSNIIVSKGKLHDAALLPGFFVYDGAEIQGLITYCFKDGECEITSINSFNENHGIGTLLVSKVTEIAKSQDCGRVWLVTTNDNTNAIRFY